LAAILHSTGPSRWFAELSQPEPEEGMNRCPVVTVAQHQSLSPPQTALPSGEQTQVRS